MERTEFPLRGQLYGFWVLTVNPGFILCYDLEREVVSDFILQFLGY